MMLQLRPGCECCDRDLPPDSTEARICSFECTLCASCATSKLGGICPNCGGELVKQAVRANIRASMGASIALLAATRLPNPDVRFGILGACLSESVRGLVAAGGKAPSGNMLAIREATDDLTEPCPAWTADAAKVPGLSASEIVVNTGLGHGFLYRPLPEWIDAVVALANAPGH